MTANSKTLAAVSLLASVIFTAALILLPFRMNQVPLGWDTPYYYHLAQSLNQLGISAIPKIAMDRALIQIAVYGLNSIYGFLYFSTSGSTYVSTFLVYAQIVLLVTYIFCLAKFTYTITRSLPIASLTAIFASLSPTTFRFQPNFSTLLDLSLILVSLTLVIDYLDSNNRRYLWIGGFLAFASLFADAFFTFYMVGLASLAIAIYSRRRQGTTSRLPSMFQITILAMLIALLGLFFIGFPYLFPEAQGRLLNLYTSLSYQTTLAAIRNLTGQFLSVTLILGLFGILMWKGTGRLVSNDFARIFVPIWFITTLTISVLGLQPDYDRIFALLPIPVTGSLFVYAAYHFASDHASHRIGMLLRPMLAVALCVIMLVSSIEVLAFQEQSCCVGPYTSQGEIQTLDWIRGSFTTNTIIMINTQENDILNWALALVWNPAHNVYLYYGNLTDLLGGRTSAENQWLGLIPSRVVANLTGYNVLMPALTYQPAIPNELMIAQRINGPDLYFIRIDNSEEATLYENVLMNHQPGLISNVNDRYALASSAERKIVWFDNQWWIFFSNGTNIVFVRECNGRISQEQVVTSSPGSEFGNSFSVWSQNDTIDYALLGDHVVYYRSGIMAANGTLVWSSLEKSIATSENPNGDVSIIRDSVHTLWIASDEGPGSRNQYGLDVWRVTNQANAVLAIQNLSVPEAPVLLPLREGVALLYGQANPPGKVAITTTLDGREWSAIVQSSSEYYLTRSSAVAVGNEIFFVGLSGNRTVGLLRAFVGVPGSLEEKTIQSNPANWYASISVSANFMALFYGVNSNVFYAVSDDNGSTWSNAFPIATNGSVGYGLDSPYDSPEIAVAWVANSGSTYVVSFFSLCTETPTC